MKKPREYKADEFGQYCDDRINKECFGAFNIVGELWLEIQELKQDLSAFQEYVGSMKNE